MGTKLAESMFRGENSAKGAVRLWLSRPAFEVLAGRDRDAFDSAGARMEAAVRCYLSDKGSGRPAWPYPDFLRASETQQDIELEMRLDEGLWNSFESEARAQGVSVQQLTEHAAFYLAAEIDAGRITQRILEGLESAGNGDDR
jgi:hypothetical protein